MFRQLSAMGLGALYTIGDRIIVKLPVSFNDVDVSLFSRVFVGRL